jgi:uncharacterized protein DUF4326
VAEHGQVGAVALYCQYLVHHPELADAARRELVGKPLAWWCPPDLPCYADVLLEVANPSHQPEGP